MINVEFADGQRGFFDSQGLKKFDDFFDFSNGQIINKNQKRDVTTFTLGDRVFFMKRFYSPHFKDMLFTFRNFGEICSQGGCEWRNANCLLANGIDTYKPVCYGYQMAWKIEKKSFFITEKINSEPLSDFVAANWTKTTSDEKKTIMTSIAKLFQRIHKAKISLPDLYVWHVFISKSGSGEYDLSIIDLHRMKNNAEPREYVRNLAAFDFSMSKKYFDDEIRGVFFDTYLEGYSDRAKKSMLSKIKSRVRKLRSRSKGHRY